ncbi:MAG: YgiQ family radical SAM protein, partial [Geobacteraceae bacterium]|nr:YgiQ family radical SAM protein [Geobacteraceae bacterium]
MSFLPISRDEANRRGWSELDVIFVSGDAYIDHPAFGVPLLARLLESRGFRVGILPQPDWRSKEAFMELGRPKLFFAVTAGAMDSMVAHYTPAKRLRRDDAYAPGNRHGSRPNRATIVYTTRLKESFKDVPVVLGGIEASLRRFAHYDYWEDKVRRSILFDAKADLLVYGMGERPLLEIAERMRSGGRIRDCSDIRGTAYISPAADVSSVTAPVREIPSWESVASDRRSFAEAFRIAEEEMTPFSENVLTQRHGDRFLVCNPPAMPLSVREMDEVYGLPFTKLPHPSYRETIPAWEQIRASITTHRGCFGGCAFCSIALHQGKIVQSRSENSVLTEVEKLTGFPWFSGSVTDVGGPTANMYGMSCENRDRRSACRRVSCLFPDVCKRLGTADRAAAQLLRKIRAIRGIRHVFVSSGIRFDLFRLQPRYFRELLAHHVGGLLKVAPEHLADTVTARMGKPGRDKFIEFLEYFRKESASLGKSQYVVPYLMSGHPGCTLSDMVETALLLKRLSLRVEQVQDFTPTPGTRATCMYYTGLDPVTGEEVYVARSEREKRLQKSLLLYHLRAERENIVAALRAAHREDVAPELLDGCGCKVK